MTSQPAGIDAVLQAGPPAFSPATACEIARNAFGIESVSAVSLGSERDQAFRLADSVGRGVAVLKISNPAEDPQMLDMEALAAFHVMRCDPRLRIAVPWSVPRPGLSQAARPGKAGQPGGADQPVRADVRVPAAVPVRADVSASRALWTENGTGYWVRAYDVLPGRARLDPPVLDDPALIAWGETCARLGMALRSFIHPRAIRRLPWDVQHAASLRPMLASIRDREARWAVTAVLDRYDEAVAPCWDLLRAQVIHGDLTADNVLADEKGVITGIVDFGDMTHTALAADLAAVLDSLGIGRDGEELFRVARLVIDGYQRVLPFEPLELELMGELWAARCAAAVAIGAWRADQGLEDREFAERFSGTALAMIENLLATGWDRVARLLSGPADAPLAVRPARTTDPRTTDPRTTDPRTTDPRTTDPRTTDPRTTGPELLARRAAAFGPAMEALSYREPIEMAAAEGTWMTDSAGRRYLDMYNNVVCVGHAHPRVTSAVARQWRVLNTNMRYLHASAIELAERLIATCPAGLDTVLFVNSGSEANDVAWRLAAHQTGNSGGLCTEFAYHGVTAATADMSPEVLPGAATSRHIATWAPPDTYRGLNLGTDGFAAALETLAARGLAPAATILDGVLQSEGVHDLDPAYVRELVRLTREAGGLWIADEVQGGHGRTGAAMWSFQRFGIVPDFVTLGKPMGNGQPVGAVITRRDLLERFAGDTVFFSTFGGNQVSMAAAHAVLDVLDDERVLPRVAEAGEVLRAAVREASAGHDRVGDVRGIGLANGIEIVTDRVSRRPDRAGAAAVSNALRRHGVLVGTTSRAGNVLKVRPPLSFTTDLVPVFVRALSRALEELPEAGT